ncbi:MAG TPA: hypothetical protein DCX78_01140 [Nitrospina sp.]|mgnify:CR=1 FL=1|jgi:hypothetical protein|nr:hypothetical protein [Nitrospina sp.]|tara:strand:- start:188 stop:595 length:408 start_codon:yes stop_codon:yes gene_type:complete
MKEEKMRKLAGAGLAVLFLSVMSFVPVSEAVEIPDPKICDTETAEARAGRPGGSVASKASGNVSAQDQRHLCLALHPIKDPTNRFMHKDHSTYYCTLILNRDSQAYCYAVLQADPKKCNNIVSKELETDCLEKSK